ncbi:caspase family protein [Mesorhizobium sp. B2-4-17]|uniref:caspase family protein n=1 Tax=Mesorhizobium sp. B2-4-17 TaxID=2589932 RepID=UPI00112BF920|nr:caspase family protein [Mesorhizobium sp. B2-4-17]TPK87356.1 hypothetical protein FJ548_14245 [Mesorhizobium sp. B2-4-17]
MLLPGDDPLRKNGLVYLDAANAAGPAAHVLIVGVGAYQSPKFKAPLTTTTISARAVADWFVDGAKAGFRNETYPLGSVAVLLSEPAVAGGGNFTSYAGGEVPRATLKEIAEAVKAWVRRINTSKDNLAILYVASHGESFLSQTAFLLEDYGLDDLDKTSGMSRIEQLAGALENATPVAQLLLFDCCRVPTDMRLPWNEELGTKLISLTRADDDHGEPRKQWVIAATSLGEVAVGRTNKTTLFADALINALDGVASDPTEDGWPVRPGTLVDKIDSLLALHRLPSERAQTPGGKMAGSFDITFPGEKSEVPVFVSFNNPAEWPDSVITVTASPGEGATIKGLENESPYRMMAVPMMADVQATAVRDGQSIGSARKKAYAPAIFLELKNVPQAAGTVVGQLDTGRSLKGRGELVIALDSAVQIGAGAVADIIWRGEAKKPVKQLTVPIGGEASLEVQDGDYTIVLRTPDGRAQTKDVKLAKDVILRVAFSTQSSPHEWLTTASVSGSVYEAAASIYLDEASGPPPPIGREDLLKGFKDILNKVRQNLDQYPGRDIDFDVEASTETAPPNEPVTSKIVGHVEIDLRQLSVPDPRLEMTTDRDDGRLVRLGIRDHFRVRFKPAGTRPENRPLFALINVAQRRELVVLPSLGYARFDGAPSDGGWSPYVLVDKAAPSEAMLSTVIVEDRIWAGLLGFIASRDMITADRLLDSGLTDMAVAAMSGKRNNPLAALAGGLVAVAASSSDVEKRWDPWLRNLAKWFPGIPDGPIILGRRLLVRARNADEIAEAKNWLFEGFGRGVPVYSLSVEWLARGLESLPGKDAMLVERRLATRGLANRVDPTRAFTVIRLDD